MARLSTHVLDTSRGAPAGGITVELHAVREAGRHHVTTVTTNRDGRTESPLLSGERIQTGVYELTFHAGEYFRANGAILNEPAFLDLVVIRFGIADSQGSYHVPLLLSPYGYTTYRGS
jgi:5-hydroxyisourate hydrolase